MKISDEIRHFIHKQIFLTRLKHNRNYFTFSSYKISYVLSLINTHDHVDCDRQILTLHLIFMHMQRQLLKVKKDGHTRHALFF